MTHVATIPPAEFWRSLSGRAVGAAVVTTMDGGSPAGFLALSVTHLSVDPPTLMMSVGLQTTALSGIRRSGAFAVNYLERGQQELASIFAGQRGINGAARFESETWGALTTGSPILKTAIGAIDCVVQEEIERFGSAIVIGGVAAYENRGGAPLLHFKGSFHPGHEI
ncbi:MAG: flavin reductase family protein [Pseudomonadota bacterium]